MFKMYVRVWEKGKNFSYYEHRVSSVEISRRLFYFYRMNLRRSLVHYIEFILFLISKQCPSNLHQIKMRKQKQKYNIR